MNEEKFKLAPMTTPILVLTVVVWLVPVALAYVNMWMVALLLCALYGLVWATMRPRSFDVSSRGLIVTFPFRESFVNRAEIAGASQLTKEEFKARFGRAMRVGVGGLWGGFGWLWTSKEGFIDFFISRTDGFVVIERLGGKPLLVTPESPARFVRAVRDITPGSH